MTQCEKILRHLQDVGSISPLDAIEQYGIMRLAARISNLRDKGYPIKSKMATGVNRYKEKVHYKIYYLEKEI